MTTIASQITSLTSVYSTVYSDADQRKHQSSASLAFVWGIHRDRWIPRTKGQLRGKCFHLMTSSSARHCLEQSAYAHGAFYYHTLQQTAVYVLKSTNLFTMLMMDTFVSLWIWLRKGFRIKTVISILSTFGKQWRIRHNPYAMTLQHPHLWYLSMEYGHMKLMNGGQNFISWK